MLVFGIGCAHVTLRVNGKYYMILLNYVGNVPTGRTNLFQLKMEQQKGMIIDYILELKERKR